LGIYREPYIHDKGFEMIYARIKPSPWDVTWVKKNYLWMGAASGDMDPVGDDLAESMEQAREEYVKNQV
jgi:hypothetical protein